MKKQRVSSPPKESQFQNTPGREIEHFSTHSEYNGRHEKFQLGTNPMAMTSFEKELVEKEAAERKRHRHGYIRGIQGRDGGCRTMEYEKEYEDGPEVN